MLIILPMAYIRTETLGDDGLWHHLYAGPEYIVNNITSDVPSRYYTPQETMETHQVSPGEKLFLLIQIGIQRFIKIFCNFVNSNF